MSIDDDMEWARDVAKFFKGLYEDDVINKAQVSIDDMSATTNVPMPNTAHPAYADYRINPSKDATTIRIRTAKRLSFDFFTATEPKDMESSFVDHTLARKTCWGPAPFVGDPLWEHGGYEWYVWVDGAGRHIASDSKLIIAQRTVPLL